MKIENGALIFSSGRKLDAVFNIVGLDLTPDEGEPAKIYSGYDGVIHIDPDPDVDREADLTTAELAELAAFMSNAWAVVKTRAMAKCHAEQRPARCTDRGWCDNESACMAAHRCLYATDEAEAEYRRQSRAGALK